jgi:hypothetical protein
LQLGLEEAENMRSMIEQPYLETKPIPSAGPYEGVIQVPSLRFAERQEGGLMFEQSVISNGKTRRTWTVLVAFAGQLLASLA